MLDLDYFGFDPHRKLVALAGVAPARPKTLRSKRSVSAVPPQGRTLVPQPGLAPGRLSTSGSRADASADFAH